MGRQGIAIVRWNVLVLTFIKFRFARALLFLPFNNFGYRIE
jgi:hypothetical protein